MSESDIKVTDKRMFTADGRLREEFRHLEDKAATPRPADEAAPRPVERPAPPPAAPPVKPPDADKGPTLEIPGSPPGMREVSFLDLVGVLAEPASIYLGDVPMPGGHSGEDLEMARVHIDLLGVLRDKAQGNLTAQEAAVLEDVIYQLRMRYVQKRG